MVTHTDNDSAEITVGQLLTIIETEYGYSSAQMAHLIGIKSKGHYSQIKTGTRKLLGKHIQRIITTIPLPTDMIQELYNKANISMGFLQPSVISLNNFLLSESISSQQRKTIEHNVMELLESWRKYLNAKNKQYNRQWSEANRDCETGIEKLDALSGRLYAYLLDTVAAVKLHQSHLNEVSDLHKEVERRLAQITVLTTSDKFLKALNALHQGDYDREIGAFNKAQAQYERAQEIFQDIGDLAEAARCDRKLAIIELYRGDWRKALALLKVCKDQFSALKNEPGANAHYDYELSKTNYALGWAFNLAGKWEDADKMHESGYAYAKEHLTKEKHPDEYMIMLGMTYSANDLRQLGNYDDSIKLYRDALKLAEKLQDRRAQAWIYLGLARLNHHHAQKIQDDDVRRTCITDAQIHFEAASNLLAYQKSYRYRYAMTLIHYASFLLWRKQDAVAEIKLIEALKTTRQLHSRYYEASALVALCRLYSRRAQNLAKRDTNASYSAYSDLATHAALVENLHQEFTYNNHMARLCFIKGEAFLAQQESKQADRQADKKAITCFINSMEHAFAFHPVLYAEIFENFRKTISQVKDVSSHHRFDLLRRMAKEACLTKKDELKDSVDIGQIEFWGKLADQFSSLTPYSS